MPLRTVSFLFVLLLSGATPSEARRRSGSSGALASERGLSTVESQAAGAVIAATASGAGSAADGPVLPARRFSPDYYRVYHQRIQAAKSAAPAPKIAAATPTPRPRVAAAAPAPRPRLPAPTPTPKPLARRVVAVAPTPAAVRASSLSRRSQPVAPTPRPRTPRLVAVMPADSRGTIYLAAGRDVPRATPAPKVAPGAKPKRRAFR